MTSVRHWTMTIRCLTVLLPLPLLLLLVAMPLVVSVSADDSDSDSQQEWWQEDVSLVIHRNGEPDPCGTAVLSTTKKDNQYLPMMMEEEDLTKYDFESVLTDAIAEALDNNNDDNPNACVSPDNATAVPMGLFGYCDMGVDRTPILLDHEELVRVDTGTLPCRWYTREGLRITSVSQLQGLIQKASEEDSLTQPTCRNAAAAKNPQEASEEEEEEAMDCNDDDDNDNNSPIEFHLYGVPAGRVFMFAPSFVGEMFDLSHLTLRPQDIEQPISMKVLSLEPRVFDILNVFTPQEADSLVHRALTETSPSHKIKRSTTGTSAGAVFTKRTSENAFDTHGKTALAVKKRIFELLGFDEFWHGHDDGLQILRYNTSKAYVQHMDYLTDRSGQELFNYDSAGKGGNRFATVLLYMSDADEGAGGETVFSEAWPSELDASERKTVSVALEELRASGDAAAAGIQEGSWEEEMIALCRSKLAIRPRRGRAVLFYSQHPNGQMDRKSRHGGCPVLNDKPKWAANLWVWNTPRNDQVGAPLREDLLAKGHKPPPSNKPRQLHATFINSGKDPALKDAELWFDEAMFWGNLGHGEGPHKVNTYTGHRWNLRVDGKIVKEWAIGEEDRQIYTV